MSDFRIGSELSSLESHVSNRFDEEASQHEYFAGIIGDRPSQYAKSPILWNTAFATLDLSAVFLPFDVEEPNLAPVVAALRKSPHLLGFSVTVPYKIKIVELLDDVESRAASIGAVNTVVRTKEGRLVGYNTDGSGFLASLTSKIVESPIVKGPLTGLDVLIIGAGGAARAAAFYLAEHVAPGRVLIANRNSRTGEALAAQVTAVHGNATYISESEIVRATTQVGLIVNSSTKGQAGLRTLSDGQATTLEPYSSLAPADPAKLPHRAGEDQDLLYHRLFQSSVADILENNRRSLDIASHVPISTAAYDLVYAPTETVFLRHLRYSGHRTMNGKGMNIAQAVDGFCDRVCAGYLLEAGIDAASARERVTQEMSRVW